MNDNTGVEVENKMNGNGKLNYLHSSRNFLTWVKADDKPRGVSGNANMLSRILFEKPYDSLLTYEKRYIAKQLVLAGAC